MPRYRFRWENLDPQLLEALCPDGDAVDARVERLRARYGARPRVDFVADAWPVLRDVWLPSRPDRRDTIISGLRAAGLGRDDIDVSSADGAATYLQSCRNAGSLRSVVLTELIREGEDAAAAMTKRVSAAWPEFEASLAVALAALSEDEHLVVTLKGTWRFAQFMAQGRYGMRAEVVSNEFRQGDDRLDPDGIEMLLRSGWRAPTSDATATARDDPDGSPNFWREWPNPVPYDEVAHLAVEALRDVDGASHPGFLRVEAFGADGSPRRVPALDVGGDAPAIAEEVAGPLLTRPQDPDELVAAVKQVLASLSGEAVVVDEDGDIPISWGSARLYVRVLDHLPIVRIFSHLVSGIAITDPVRDAVNEINRDRLVVRALWADDAVVITADLFASTFSEDNFVNVLHTLAEAADELDDSFVARFANSVAGRPGYGGYL